MTSPLRSTISDLAASFAASIVAAIRSSNLEDILGLAGAEAPAPIRRGPGRPRKARGGTGTGNPGKLAGGGWGSSSLPAGGGGQPDPLGVPARASVAVPAPAKAAAASRRAPSPKKTPAAAKRTAAAAKKFANPGRLPRRSADEIARALAKVVALVKSDTGGLRAEQIRERLGMESKEMPRVLKEGLAKKVLKSKGVKRSTTYTAA
jgi:hypothetical protein